MYLMSTLRFGVFLFLLGVSSQILCGQNVSTLNVSDLSDAQVEKISQEIENNGLDQDQATTLAKARGASQLQIDQLLQRMQQMDTFPAQNDQVNFSDTRNNQSINNHSVKATVETSVINTKTFGYQLFNSDNLTFEPSFNIPTSNNYILGIGDELLITIWGASQATYKLSINSNGSVIIPDLGPVYLNGSTFETAKKQIQNRLESIYSGLKKGKPNTWSDINLTGGRSIRINIAGEANLPGTYTLPSTASAYNALYLSGGPNENGSFRNIKLIRNGEIIKIIDVYDFLVNAEMSGNLQLQEDDIVFIPTYQSKVKVVGAFKRDGFFEIKADENLDDLIHFAGGFSNNAYTQNLSLIRSTDREKKVLDISKADFDKFQLKNGDVLKADILLDRFENRVSINGSVFRPGDYEWKEGMKLSELLEKAEGANESAFRERAYISRRMENWEWKFITFNLGEIEKGLSDITLQHEDVVTIRSHFDLREEQTISIVGQVQDPGSLIFNEGMTLKDVIYLSGGFKEAADVSYIDIARRLNYEETTMNTDTLLHIYTFPVSRNLMMTEENENFKILPFDKIFVRKAPGFNNIESVNIIGEVIYAGDYPLQNKKERISDLIKRAGGLTPEAYLKGATLSRRLTLRPEELETRIDLMKQDTSLVLKLYGTEMVGIDLSVVQKKPGSDFDLLLLPGDKINIPQKYQTVKVSGNVMNPIKLSYVEGQNLLDYVNNSGGFGSRTKKSNIYVIYPNGITKSTKGNFITRNYPSILPGSEIIIPQKPEKRNADQTGKWLAIASTLSSLAIAIKTVF
jgi:protein involved in polysaccharide export with SLBB domain